MEQDLSGRELLTLRVDLDLVSEWAPVLERLATAHGALSQAGVQGTGFVVEVAIEPARKDAFLADMQRYWGHLVERRKREGRWSG